MIPNNIIQFWDKPDNLPKLLKKSMEITLKNNPDATVIFADDTYMLDFIETKYSRAIARLYSLNNIPASKADIARLMLLYEFGGFYIDVSMELKGSLTSFISSETELLLVLRDDNPLYKDHPRNAHAINGIIGAPAKSKFIMWCIQRVFRNLVNDDLNNSVHIATGPIVINQALKKHESSLNIEKLSFKKLRNEFLHYRREKGVSNNWTKIQQHGLIDKEYYYAHSKQYEKTWVFMSKLYHISLRSLALKTKSK